MSESVKAWAVVNEKSKIQELDGSQRLMVYTHKTRAKRMANEYAGERVVPVEIIIKETK